MINTLYTQPNIGELYDDDDDGGGDNETFLSRPLLQVFSNYIITC